MTRSQKTLTWGGAAALILLASIAPADGQVRFTRGVNPWTGRPYRNAAVPWTAALPRDGVVLQPWTSATVPGWRRYNPWTGRTGTVDVAYNSWTGRYHWSTNPRQGDW